MIALTAQQLQVFLAGKRVLHGMDVSFQSGRWTAIVGPNGAGKSTLLKALAGLLPYSGEIVLQHRDLSRIPAKQKAQQLAWLGQSSDSSDEAMTVYDTVMLGRLPYQGWLAAPSAADRAAVMQALQQTQLWNCCAHRVSALSGGERQRVFLARVLAVQAAVVLMDEPLLSLDPAHQVDWVNTVRALIAQGTTVISVLHEINVALAADDLLIMDAGRAVHSGACQQIDSVQALEKVFNHRIQIHSVRSALLAGLRFEPKTEPS